MMKCTCASCGITKTKFVQSAKVTPAMMNKIIKQIETGNYTTGVKS